MTTTQKRLLIYIAIGVVVYYLGYKWYKYNKCQTNCKKVNALNNTAEVESAVTMPPCKCNFWKSNGY